MDTEVLFASDYVRATPYRHQQDTFARSWDKPYWALFMEQGTGKTLVSLATIAALQERKGVTGALVICADGLHYNWKREIEQFAKFKDATVALWDSSMGKRAQAYWDYVASSPNVNFPVLLVNIEALRLKRFQESLQAFVQNRRIITIIDESTCIANPKAQQSKEAFKLGLYSCHTRILSGTPIRKNLEDLWAQCHFLSPTALPYPSFIAFSREFAIKQVKNFGGRAVEVTLGFQNETVLTKLISKFSTRVEKKDCLDLPAKIYSTIDVPLTEEQKTHYKTLEKHCFLDLPTGLLTIPMVLPKIIKFQQIVSGWVFDEQGVCNAIRSNRLQALKDLLARSEVPSIIFCAFKEDVLKVAEYLLSQDKRVCVYTGDTPSASRVDAVEGFQGRKYDYFIATRAASKGLTLHRAEMVIYYSQGWSLETRLQSEDRAHRIGLTHPVNYVTFRSPGTIDEKIAMALMMKKELAETILSSDDLKAAVSYSADQVQP